MVRKLTFRSAALGALAAFSLLFQSNITYADEVKLATAKPDDAFVRALLNSPSLEKTGIKVIVQQVATDEDALDAVLKGSADLGLFLLEALFKRQFDDQPKLYSVFTRPFFFESSDQIFRFEQTPLGDAVLADLGRAGVFPMAYWNRGLSQVVAKRPLESVESFRGLTVARLKEDTAQPILMSLGAQPIATRNVASEFGKANVGAVVWKPLDDGTAEWLDSKKYGFQIYATDFQPNVGVLVGSLPYWNGLQASEKDAWKTATNYATKQSITEIDKREYISRGNKKINFVSANSKLTMQFESFDSKDKRLVEDYRLLNEAKAFVSSQDASGKKKPN
jgi:TRAP-type C4-dicarboxylate transport system substrate-binding protein